jgi:hypothetical protein
MLLTSGFILSATASFSATTEEMPVNRVILSTSGLAQFEHHAKVNGNNALQFPVRLEQVDDILKSLIVFDKQGRLGGVTLPGKQPLDQVFKDLPFNQRQLGDSMMLLNSYQGALLTVKTGKTEISGKILQVIPETVSLEDNKTIIKHRLSIMGDSGIKEVLLEDATALQFADGKIRDEINKALDSIRENSTTGRRMLTVNLLGSGTRDVTLSYVVEAPLWKTAYRMVVPETGKTAGLLQGWAVVENMTASDWQDVDLSLVSGNPVTFHQALYQSYYVQRPDVPVQVFGRIMPRVDTGTIAMGKDKDTLQDMGSNEQKKERSFAAKKTKGVGGAYGGMQADAPMAVMAMAPAPMEAEMDSTTASTMENVAQGAQAVQSAEATTQVLFRFPDRFSLKSGQSMMLPFVSHDVPMERVSLYQSDTQAKHPLAAIEVKNNGDTGLPAGVLTLYEDSSLLKGTSFIGDAQMPLISSGEKRLISYALDSKTTIDREDKSLSSEDKFSAAGGVIRTSIKNRAETIYTIKAPEKEDRTVILEHPRMGGDYKLVTPAPDKVEMTDAYYRIRVAVKAGETVKQPVVLENEAWQSYSIVDLGTEQLMSYASGHGNLSPETRKIFNELAELRHAVDQIDQKIAQLEQQRQVIFQDQERVRQNLESLKVKSDVQKKYLDKLNDQEDMVVKIDKEKESLATERAKRQATLQEKIMALKF